MTSGSTGIRTPGRRVTFNPQPRVRHPNHSAIASLRYLKVSRTTRACQYLCNIIQINTYNTQAQKLVPIYPAQSTDMWLPACGIADNPHWAGRPSRRGHSRWCAWAQEFVPPSWWWCSLLAPHQGVVRGDNIYFAFTNLAWPPGGGAPLQWSWLVGSAVLTPLFQGTGKKYRILTPLFREHRILTKGSTRKK